MRRFLIIFLISLIFISIIFISRCNKSDKVARIPPGGTEIKDSVLVKNLNYPWEILWGPDGFIWMTERWGRISRVNPITGVVIPLLTVTEVKPNNEGGMLGMVLHPNFSINPYVFVAYDYDRSGTYKERIIRFTYNGRGGYIVNNGYRICQGTSIIGKKNDPFFICS